MISNWQTTISDNYNFYFPLQPSGTKKIQVHKKHKLTNEFTGFKLFRLKHTLNEKVLDKQSYNQNDTTKKEEMTLKGQWNSG